MIRPSRSSVRVAAALSSAAALVAIAAMAAMTAGAGACSKKPAEGGPCNEIGKFAVNDATSVLVCQNGTFARLTCRGPKGVVDNQTTIACDDTVAANGDNCLPESNSNAACSVDGKSQLTCSASASGATFSTTAQCRGPKGCTISDNNVYCDMTLQTVGDPCSQPGLGTCSEDKKRRLACKDGAWATDRFCRGSRGCGNDGKELDCDESVARLGDPCGASNAACSEDNKTELLCVGGEFIKHKDCKTWCRVLADQSLDCE